MKKFFAVILYFVLAKLRTWAFERNPQRYRDYFLKRKARYSKTHFPFFAGFKSFLDYPILTKRDFLAHFKELNALGLDYEYCLSKGQNAEARRDFADCDQGINIGLSSGTSGQRGVFLTSEKERLQWVGAILAKANWFPLFSKSRVAFFLRSNSPIYESTNASRLLTFRFFDLAQDFDKLLSDLQLFCPNVIIAPPYILKELLNRNLLSKEKIKLIVSVADVLDADLKQSLKSQVGIPVHEIYQATEGFLGITCSKGTLHLNEDILCFEKRPYAGNAHAFSPIVTDYFRQTQVFNRFLLEDVIVEDTNPCSCRSKMLAVKCIQGRDDEVLRYNGPSSEVLIFPDFIRHAVQNTLTVQQDYCVAKRDDGMVIRTDQPLTADQKQQLGESFAELFKTLKLTTPELRYESGLNRPLSQKRKRVYIELS